MSQKPAKRSRRHTEDELDTAFKVPGASKTKEESPKASKDEADSGKTEANGLKGDGGSKTESTNGENGDTHGDSPKRVIQTRSRSNTPLNKTPEQGKPEADANEEEVLKSDEKTSSLNDEDNGGKHEKINGVKDDSESVDNSKEEIVISNGDDEGESPITLSISHSPEAEPVAERDEEEPIPELQFDENDLDLESEGSPSRCKTRRSQTRNVSTPKTPKLIVEQEIEPKPALALDRLPDDNASGKSTPRKLISSNNSNIGTESLPDEIGDFDTSDTYSSVSTDNISTRAVVGSDTTRNADFSYQDSGLYDENTFGYLGGSFTERLKNMSPRRSVHSTGSDYRKMALRNSLDIKDYESVQKFSAGLKRKNRSTTPEETKRFKKDSAGILSYIAAPITNIRRSFSRSSTPKLVRYDNKMEEYDVEDDIIAAKIRIENGNRDDHHEQKWCSIM